MKRLRPAGSKTQVELPVVAFKAKREDTKMRGATAEAQSRVPAVWLLGPPGVTREETHMRSLRVENHAGTLEDDQT